MTRKSPAHALLFGTRANLQACIFSVNNRDNRRAEPDVSRLPLMQTTALKLAAVIGTFFPPMSGAISRCAWRKSTAG
jgi:hypothetical protein